MTDTGTARGDLVISGRGAGYRVRRTAVPDLGPDPVTTYLPVKLRGTKPPRRITLTVAGPRQTQRVTVPIRRLRASVPPAGSYEGNGDVSFVVRRGSLVGFRGRVPSTCRYGGLSGPLTPQTFTYTVNRAQIYANGRVHGVDDGADYRVSVLMRLTGAGRATGDFQASTSTCQGNIAFTARRTTR